MAKEIKKYEVDIKAPAGYQEQSGDISGFWTGAGAIHFIPRFVRMFDSSIDKLKTSTLLVAELVEPCKEIGKVGDDGTVISCAKGDLVGIWTKPGMRALGNLAGIPVFMYADGEIDTGKPNPMVTYKIMSKSKGLKLPVDGDYRVTIRPASAPQQVAQAPVSSDDIPF
jgi:hypothetical protein